MHPCGIPSQPGSPPNILPQCSSTDGFTSALPVILLPSWQSPFISQFRGIVLTIFLIQQCLKPAVELSPLQTASSYLLLQQLLQLVIGDFISGLLPPPMLSYNTSGPINKQGHFFSLSGNLLLVRPPQHVSPPPLVIFQNMCPLASP